MDYREDQTIVDFRQEVQTFISDNLPDDWGSRAQGEGYDAQIMEVTRAFQSEMAKRRWLTMAWPEEHGGLDAPHSQQMIMSEEMAYHRAPGAGGNMGVQWVGPSLMLYGTDEQKQEHLSGIADAETWWCTLYSEPGSGSDLASLQTRAVK
ncbi:MAG: acyl-CoA dehydrogenase family protein, partial [Chloroflexi bacterium]|nr:acyl-CoA dehydrogenase family protein [Chloroflexota bacterium]